MKIKRLLTSLIFGLGMTLTFLGLLAAGSMTLVYAGTYTVTNTAASGPGSLRQAILDANGSVGHDMINFSPSVSGTIVLTDALPAVSNALTISGPGAELLVISGANTYRVFYINNGVAVTITGVTVRDGSAGYGGGIYSGGALLLQDMRVVSNSASSGGGGMYVLNGSVTLSGTQVVSNSAGSNGGGVSVYLGNMTLSGAQVVSNSAGFNGGGIYVDQSGATLNVNDGMINSNSATINGGGVYVLDGNAMLSGAQVLGNLAAVSGGGVSAYRGNTTLSGTQVVSNSAGFNGGGVYVFDGSVTLSGVQIVANDAPSGGALYTRGVITSTTALTVTGDIYQGGDSRFVGSSYDLRIEGSLDLDGGHFYAPVNLELTGLFTHTGGTYHQTQIVVGSSDVGFPKAGGVILNANGQDLGSTDVALTAGDNCAGVTAGGAVAHCYMITPAIATGRAATITFYYNDSEIPVGQSCAAMEAFRWDSTWNNLLTRDGSYGTDGRMCSADPLSIKVTGVMTFSPFVLNNLVPEITVLSSTLHFGDQGVDMGPTPVQTVTITNDGSADLHISTVTPTGDTGDFNLVDSGEITVTSGSMRTIGVSFDPSSVGGKVVTLTIQSDDSDEPTVEVTLNGTGIITAHYIYLPLVLRNN